MRFNTFLSKYYTNKFNSKFFLAGSFNCLLSITLEITNGNLRSYSWIGIFSVINKWPNGKNIFEIIICLIRAFD